MFHGSEIRRCPENKLVLVNFGIVQQYGRTKIEYVQRIFTETHINIENFLFV